MHTVTWLNTDDQHLAQIMQHYLENMGQKLFCWDQLLCMAPDCFYISAYGELTVIDSCKHGINYREHIFVTSN